MGRAPKRFAERGIAIDGANALALALRVGRFAALRVERATAIGIRLGRGAALDARHRLGLSARLPGGTEIEARRVWRLRIAPARLPRRHGRHR